jgi:hypothetical protein
MLLLQREWGIILQAVERQAGGSACELGFHGGLSGREHNG